MATTYIDRLAGVKFKTNEPYNKDDLMTKAEMLSDAYGYNGKLTVCSEELELYIYDENYTSAETGHFKKYENGLLLKRGDDFPNASYNLADKCILSVETSTDATIKTGFVYQCKLVDSEYKWVVITGEVFTDVADFPTANIDEQKIYRKKTSNFIKKYKIKDSESSNYTIGTNGITTVATGEVASWDDVSNNWAAVWSTLTVSDDIGDITNYYNDNFESKFVDTASYSEAFLYICKFYKDGKWSSFCANSSGSSTVVINNLLSTSASYALSANMGRQLNESKVEISDIQDVLNSTSADKPLSANMGKKLSDEKVNTSDIVDDLTTSATTKPLSANMGKKLSDEKVDIADIIDNLTTEVNTKPLSAKQGKELKALIDGLDGVAIKVVGVLPATIDNNTLYFIGTAMPYEMILVDTAGTKHELGHTSSDIGDYVEKSSILSAKDASATDEKIYSAKYSNNNFVDKSGDTLSGTLKFTSATAITSNANNSYVRINGGDTSANGGAYLTMTGKDSSYKGEFSLGALNTAASSVLNGKPDGTLTWNDKAVICRDVKYIHNVRVTHSTNQFLYWSCIVITTSKTAFTRTSLASWLYTNGFTTVKNTYNMGVSGTTGTVQVSTPSATTYVANICSGLFSSNGTDVIAKVNYNGTTTYGSSATVTFSDVVIEI